MSLIAADLARTPRISSLTDVVSLQLRPPAVMANAAVSLDVLSGSRFELGLVPSLGPLTRDELRAGNALIEAAKKPAVTRSRTGRSSTRA